MAQRTTGIAKLRSSRLIGLIAAVASLVLMTAAPAHAVGNNQAEAVGGTGFEDDIVFGNDFGTFPGNPCFEVTSNTNHVDFANNDVTANATTTSPSATATYERDATFEWHINQTMYIAPAGAYSAPANPTPPNSAGCDSGTLGDPIAATATFHGETGSGAVLCASGNGNATYTRVDDAVTVTFASTCTVTDDTGAPTVTTPTSVTSTLHSVETPCITPPNNCDHSTLHDATYNYS